ncbi:MAG: FAD:protein FMN transferase [Bdellovibrionales bacterium]|nr:FAD:protein FMN transferase [Bdellovibrionales bacterium]
MDKRQHILFIFLIISTFSLSSCAKRSYQRVYRGSTMGTTYNITIYTGRNTNIDLLQKNTEKILAEINQQMSTYDSTSLISKFNKSKANVGMQIPEDFASVVEKALRIASDTSGIYDPTIGPLVNVWGFGPTSTRHKPSIQDIKKAMSLVGFQKINLTKNNNLYTLSKSIDGVELDLSSIAKGFAVDKISTFLTYEGHQNHLVEIGGEMRSAGNKNGNDWIVGIERPVMNKRSIIRYFALQNTSLATSGNYRNYFEEDKHIYAHTLDPFTGYPAPTTLLSVSVLASSCAMADGLSTALMAMGEEKATQYVTAHNIDALFIVRGEDQFLQTISFGKFKELVKEEE